ncbi:hypothetical protein D3C71_1713210 [compost metagenome]
MGDCVMAGQVRPLFCQLIDIRSRLAPDNLKVGMILLHDDNHMVDCRQQGLFGRGLRGPCSVCGLRISCHTGGKNQQGRKGRQYAHCILPN